MNRNPFPLWLLLGALAESAFAQSDMKLVIDPAQPDSNDLITISVTNSSCLTYADVDVLPALRLIRVSLETLSGYTDTCREENPDAPDYSAVVGPLEAGDYHVTLHLFLGGLAAGGLVDSLDLSVSVAQDGLPEGGINGLWYDPDANGHYVNILHFDFGTLIIWNTFDPDGNPAWIYAVGQLSEDGATVPETPAWINVGGRVSLDGEFDRASAERWGTVSVEMQDCHSGVFRFNSERSDFGSGELPLKRLARVKQVGCADRD